MASNLSTIGFTFADDKSFESTMIRLANEARERLATDAGEYAIWRSRTGAEIWFHLGVANAGTGERDIVGLTPYFEGESDIALAVTAALQRPDDNPLEGIVHGWVAPDGTGIGSYPIVYEAVDYAAHAKRELPAEWRCRIAGFCRELAVYENAEAMLKADDDIEGIKPAAQALIPIGLFTDTEGEADDDALFGDDDSDDSIDDLGQPTPTVLIRGIVRAHKPLQNEITGSAFHWMLIDTLDATFDLCADAELVTTPPKVGSAVEAYAWLFGRVIG
jgi:hypothetical protein